MNEVGYLDPAKVVPALIVRRSSYPYILNHLCSRYSLGIYLPVARTPNVGNPSEGPDRIAAEAASR